MRVEAAALVPRLNDRRSRTWERRMVNERREEVRPDRRVRRVVSAWMSAPFGAHLLGQIEPGPFAVDSAILAFAQPESRMTPRPSIVRAA